eukprot:1720476-Rhodomonas_salina.1
MRKRQGDSNREEDEDDTQESSCHHSHPRGNRSRNVRLYINSVWVLGLTIADVVAFVVFQLFTGPNHDFVCSGSKDTEIRFHVGQIIFLASIIFLHFCYVVQSPSSLCPSLVIVFAIGAVSASMVSHVDGLGLGSALECLGKECRHALLHQIMVSNPLNVLVLTGGPKNFCFGEMAQELVSGLYRRP